MTITLFTCKHQIFLPSPNKREHWARGHERNTLCKIQIHEEWRKQHPNIELPCCVELVRISSRDLDDDNLRSAFKGVRDIVADLLIPGLAPGQADRDKRIEWGYSQCTSHEHITKGFKVIIYKED